MRLELDSVRADSSQPGQTEDLKSAAIGQERAIPTAEPMQPARPRDQFLSGAQVQMVGIAQYQGKADLSKFLRRHRFDGCLGSDRHKDRRLDRGMGQGQASATRLTAGFYGIGQRLEMVNGPSGRRLRTGGMVAYRHRLRDWPPQAFRRSAPSEAGGIRGHGPP